SGQCVSIRLISRSCRASTPSAQAGQYGIQSRQEQVSVLGRENHGRTDLQDVVMRSDATDQNSALTHGIDDGFGARACRLASAPVRYHLDGKEHSAPPDISNDRILALQLTHPAENILSNTLRVL